MSDEYDWNEIDKHLSRPRDPENYDWKKAWEKPERQKFDDFFTKSESQAGTSRPVTVNGASAYGTKALQDELQSLANTPEGSRNHQLFKSAAALAELVASGHLSDQATRQELYRTAIATGLTASETRSTIASGFKHGFQQPRDVPPLETGVNVTEVPQTAITGNNNEPAYLFKPGGSFILDTDPEPKALWGEGDQVLWADGEALLIPAPQGVGKTTLAGQLALGRCGFTEYKELLGFPIIPGQKRVLYLAMDRPKQAARSFRRMVGSTWRAELDAKLSVWQGPPPHDLAKYPHLLLKLCEQADADSVLVDSIKDAAIGLSDDDVGAGYNRARQIAIAAGVQVVELHHLRKALSGAKAQHPTIDDVYGSTWITSGAGSVILLNGKAGDPIVDLHHLKQPANEFGPVKIFHDQESGRSTIWHTTDLLALAKKPGGITALDAARALYTTDKPTAAEREKARRKLEKLQRDGWLTVLDAGDKTTNKPAKWAAK